MSLLEEAKTIREERSAKYGSPCDNMEVYAGLVQAYLKHKLKDGVVIDPIDGAIIGGVLMKVSREAHEHNKDNLLDGIGWFDVAGECFSKLKKSVKGFVQRILD